MWLRIYRGDIVRRRGADVPAERAAIKKWSDEEFIGARGILTPEEVSDDGDVVTVVGDWRSNHANGRSSFTFDVDGDSISRMTIREG